MLLGSQKTALHQVEGSADSYFFDVSRKPDFQLTLFGAGARRPRAGQHTARFADSD